MQNIKTTALKTSTFILIVVDNRIGGGVNLLNFRYKQPLRCAHTYIQNTQTQRQTEKVYWSTSVVLSLGGGIGVPSGAYSACRPGGCWYMGIWSPNTSISIAISDSRFYSWQSEVARAVTEAPPLTPTPETPPLPPPRFCHHQQNLHYLHLWKHLPISRWRLQQQ